MAKILKRNFVYQLQNTSYANLYNKNMKDIFITKININQIRHLNGINIPLSNKERKHLILTGKIFISKEISTLKYQKDGITKDTTVLKTKALFMGAISGGVLSVIVAIAIWLITKKPS